MKKVEFLIRRKTGYLSSYPLNMFWGAYRADAYFAEKCQRQYRATPHIQVGRKVLEVPHWAMIVFRPFNKYTETLAGERFV